MNWRARLPQRETVLRNRLLRPFARHLRHPSLWHLNRRSVERGVAIGFFFAFITPMAQFVFAALVAVPARANIAVAVTSTLITNPLTFPPVFYLAHELGEFLVKLSAGRAAVETALEPHKSLLASTFDAVGLTALGLAVFAVVAAPVGFLMGRVLWRMHIAGRWRRRERKAAGPDGAQLQN